MARCQVAGCDRPEGCDDCGAVSPPMFMVPDHEWIATVGPENERLYLCLGCFRKRQRRRRVKPSGRIFYPFGEGKSSWVPVGVFLHRLGSRLVQDLTSVVKKFRRSPRRRKA